jgi:hypothetical protein
LTPARIALIACGVGLLAWAVAAVAQTPGADLPRHVSLTLAAWAVWVAAIWLGLGLPESRRGHDLAFIFAVAVLIRLPLLSSPPSLSDDVYRAVWDARLVHAGVNPYGYAPAAPELLPYRDDVIWPRVNHKEQRTPYPPLAEMLGAAAYALAPERIVTMQALAAVLDLAAAALLAWLLRTIGADPRRCIVVAWSPIGAVHFAHSGHNDAAMIVALVGAALLVAHGRPLLAGAALGLATMAKWLPAVMLPAFVRATGPATGAGWAAACALLSLPFLGAGAEIVTGVLQEGRGQRFNESTFLIVERALNVVLPTAAPLFLALYPLAVVALAAALSWIWGEPTARGALVGGSRVLAAYLLAASVVEPWYLTWLAPLVALTLQRGRFGFMANDALAWLWLSGTATLTELTYAAEGMALWPLIRAVEYGPVSVLLALAPLRWTRTQRGTDR